MEQIQSQEQWVLHRLEKFYSIQENITKVSDILNGKSTLSLRLIDWFVTNYAKKFNVAFMTKEKYVIVYLSYKSHLKAYSKKMFDPFCRCKRIKFQGLDTTVGQLNFFEWIITDGVIDYLETHRLAVHADMESRLQELKDTSDKVVRRKRHELSNSATNSLSRHDVTVKVSFD
jgi:myosin-crossreactive antigen